jgi:hypothetical protein
MTSLGALRLTMMGRLPDFENDQSLRSELSRGILCY